MKLRMLVAISTCALSAMVPATATARHHASHRHGAQARHHKPHAHHARVLRFGAPSTTPAGLAGGQPNLGPSASPASETAGSVASFANGVLTIALNDGSAVSGKVTDATKLRCESASAQEANRDDESGDDESGDDDRARAADVGSHEVSGDDGERDDESGEDRAPEGCSTAALLPGTVVREAELELGSAGAVWEEVELVR